MTFFHHKNADDTGELAKIVELCDVEPELTPEGAEKLAAILSRPGRRIPKLAALLKRR